MNCAPKPLLLDRIWRRLLVLTQTASATNIATGPALARKYYWRLMRWLRPLEAMVRRMLLLEALALPAPTLRAKPLSCARATAPPR